MSIAENLTKIAVNQEKVFIAGNKAQKTAFWNVMQTNGTRTDYNMGFSGRGWTKDNFTPDYDIKPRSAERMFYQFNYQSPKFDFVEHLNQLGKKLDFSDVVYNSWSYTFGYMNVSRLGVLDLRGISSLSNAFYNCPVEKIDKLIVNENNTYSSAFNTATSLADITIEGTIANTISFGNCPLIKSSFESVVKALSSETSGLTATFKKSAKESAFTTDEWNALIATKTNWTFSLA